MDDGEAEEMLESESEEEEREDERDTGQPLTLASDPPLSIPLDEISGGIFSLGVSKTPRAASRERGTAKDISGQKRIGRGRARTCSSKCRRSPALDIRQGRQSSQRQQRKPHPQRLDDRCCKEKKS